MAAFEINYDKVKSTVSSLKTDLNASSINTAYGKLISSFTDSEGEEAKALRNLLKAEKNLITELEGTLSQFAGSIQLIADEFERLDKTAATGITQSGSKTE